MTLAPKQGGDAASTGAGAPAHTILKMRFSREAFSVREAEEWWAGNRARVVREWNIVE